MPKKGYKQTKEHIKKRCEDRINNWISHPYPRGMLGKKHSDETKKIIGIKSGERGHTEIQNKRIGEKQKIFLQTHPEALEERRQRMLGDKNPGKRLDSRLKRSGNNSSSKRPEVKEKMSLARKKLFENPEFRERHRQIIKNNFIIHPELAKQNSERLKKLYNEHPEKHMNIIMAQKGFISRPQKYLFESIKKVFNYDTVKLEFPVKTKRTTRFIDVAIPQYLLGFEYDGEQWHKDTGKDMIRDLELKEVGWTIIHIKKGEV